MRKQGYRCPEWTKSPGSVLSGIETVRYQLMPTMFGEPRLYFVDGAPGVNEHVDHLMLYHWALGPDGRPTDQPDEIVVEDPETGEQVLDDECDALRYAVMNTFKNRGKVTAPSLPEERIQVPTPQQVQTFQQANRAQNKAWAQQIMEHVFGPNAVASDSGAESDDSIPFKGRKGNIFWDM
jgi:hypothetical protein